MAAVGIAAFFVAGCNSAMDPTSSMSDYTIALLPPKHFHAFTTNDTIFFQVTNAQGTGVAGLTPSILCQLKGSDRMVMTKSGDIIDNHDGIYYWKTIFYGAGFHTIRFDFERNSMIFTKTFPFEATFAGGERIFCPNATTPTANYQVRWNAIPGLIHSGDTVTFQIELKRSVNTPVITDKPWTNTFDHITPADLIPADTLPTIAVSDGTQETVLAVTYKGLGIYAASTIVSAVSAQTIYWLHVSFETSCGKVDENGQSSADYKFPVMPAMDMSGMPMQN
jgi:hypothetical protein